MGDLISRHEATSIPILPKEHIKIFKSIDDASETGWNEALSCVNMLPPAEPEIIKCKDCKHFHYDMPYVIQGLPVFGHEVCDFWGGGCKTTEDGYCSYAERRTDGEDIPE